jgi:predicted acylesterase/phospholipase RssA
MKRIEPLGILDASRFDTIVFAGGGNRCWWQAGIVTHLLDRGWQLPAQLVGTSAGAAIAASCMADGPPAALEACRKLYSANSRLFDWAALRERKIRFAHEQLYPAWLALLIHADNFHNVKTGPTQLRVALTQPAKRLGLAGSVAIGTLAYLVDKYVWESIHPQLPKVLGLQQVFMNLHECETAADAQQLLWATAAAPPFMPAQRLQQVHCIDGGYTDNAPIPQQSAGEREKTLVLLTRHYPHLPSVFRMNDRTYWQPSRKVPVSTWDCTAASTVEDAFMHGVEDAKSAAARQVLRVN